SRDWSSDVCSSDLGRARIEARPEHRHVEESRTSVDDDLAPGASDESLRGLDVHRIKLMRFQHARALEGLLVQNAGNDRLAFGNGAGGNVNIPQHIVVHSGLIGCNLRDTSGADNQNVLFQLARNTFLSVTSSACVRTG